MQDCAVWKTCAFHQLGLCFASSLQMAKSPSPKQLDPRSCCFNSNLYHSAQKRHARDGMWIHGVGWANMCVPEMGSALHRSGGHCCRSTGLGIVQSQELIQRLHPRDACNNGNNMPSPMVPAASDFHHTSLLHAHALSDNRSLARILVLHAASRMLRGRRRNSCDKHRLGTSGLTPLSSSPTLINAQPCVLSDPAEILSRDTRSTTPVFCGIADYRCYTPTSFCKIAYRNPKTGLGRGVSQKSLPLKPIAL